MSATALPLIFVDQVQIGVLEGTGDSVQLTFSSPHAGETVEQIPIVRVAMTRLAFLGLAEMVKSVAADLTAATDGARSRAN